MSTIKEQLDLLNQLNAGNWQKFFDIIHNIDLDECKKIVIDTIS